MTKKVAKKVDEMSDLISQAEAARLRGVSRAAIADLIKRGKLRSVSVAGRALVYRSDIINYEQGEPGRPRKTEG
jgi:excisionase family DNA binding protein